jgi:hypothetical protein
MGFYKSFLFGNAIMLIILLAVMAVLLSNKAKTQTFPPEISKCPDFYSQNSEGSCLMTQSVYSSQKATCTSMYPNTMDRPAKRLWASECGVSWDGITNSSII